MLIAIIVFAFGFWYHSIITIIVAFAIALVAAAYSN